VLHARPHSPPLVRPSLSAMLADLLRRRPRRTIAEHTGNPHDTEPWEWQRGFYPGSRPGECTGAKPAPTSKRHGKCSCQTALKQTFRHGMIKRPGRQRSIAGSIAASVCRTIGGRALADCRTVNILIGHTPPIPSRIAGEHSWRTHHRRCRYRFLCWFDPLDNQRSCGPFLPRTSVEIWRGKFYLPVRSVRPTCYGRGSPPE
jgi:hypothetical protein